MAGGGPGRRSGAGVLAPRDAEAVESLESHLPHVPSPLLLRRVDSAAVRAQVAGEEGPGGGGAGRVDDEAEDRRHVLRRVDERHALLEVRAGCRAVAQVDGCVVRASGPGHGGLALARRFLEARHLAWIRSGCRGGAPVGERIAGGVGNSVEAGTDFVALWQDVAERAVHSRDEAT
jgi:hypothetical protein